jgi:hypothetical protein
MKIGSLEATATKGIERGIVMTYFRIFICILLIVQPVWTMYGCGGSASAPTPPSSTTRTPTSVERGVYDGGNPAQVDTNGEGKVLVESTLLEIVYDITVKDEHDRPIQGIEVDYLEFDGLSYIVFADPNGQFVPTVIFSEPSGMSNIRSLSDTYGGYVKRIQPPSNDLHPQAIGTIALVVVMASLYYAQYHVYSHSYQVATFYYSDMALAHDDWILYCKTIKQWAQYEYHRNMAAVNLAGIAITFVTAGAGAKIYVKKEILSMGADYLADKVAQMVLDQFADLIDADEVILGIMVFPIPGGGLRNVFAEYRFHLNHPICVPQDGSLSGTLVNATSGEGIEGMVTVSRLGYSETVYTVNANYSFFLLEAGTYSVTASSHGFDDSTKTVTIGEQNTTLNFALSPIIVRSGEYRIILEWGENPRDLDSHLYTPVLSDGIQYHIYYGNKGSLSTLPYCHLDVDEVWSYGPETVTIRQGVNDNYVYRVHHFSGTGTLALSGATVKLFGEGGLINAWQVPNIESTHTWWKVFEINPVTGTITNHNILE